MNETGIGARVINFITDTTILFFISLGLYKWWSFYVINWGYRFIPFYVFFFVTLVLYYTMFEGLTGRTPGKYLSLSKVVNSNFKKPSIATAFLRSLLRLTIIDAFFIPFLNRPLHDAITKSKVVET